MTKKIEYPRKSAFINRTEELNFLSDWIHEEPNEILFLYGPKSSGKTTLLMKFIELHVNGKDFNIKHFNLRKVLIANYTDFIQAFFEVDYSKSPQEIKQRSEYSLKVFKLSKEIKKSLENKILDPFVVMENELKKFVKKGKRPVIIIDELQAMENIYMNGQRELLNELFNFWVAITKESHLCHVIIASSDGYFMKRIYEDSKLTKTSIFFAVDYLNEKDTKNWLRHLNTESNIKQYTLSNSQIDLIWKYLGGSIWEISYLLKALKKYALKQSIPNEYLMEKISDLITVNYGKFQHYALYKKDKVLLFKEIYDICIHKPHFDFVDLKSLIIDNIYNNITLLEELITLVKMNYLAFNPVDSSYQLQGSSMFYGLEKFTENFTEDFVKLMPENVET
ncbi:MAG: ATPase [Candidatus Magnetoglobus multicellularis str. Araruama]|uniref:ATPase n=1 Tax=Candidatus Magnetoglobus multicellularis str. Araruama TaxID=890399 RepID=A0A1V1NWH9_9BACT|nr:MAG: ATPase [Candidatus Magnetoglobus multicellularis str. Araruama]